MPAVSPAQKRLMEAAAHTKGGYGGVPQSIGKEFVGDAGSPQAAGVVFVAPDGDVLLLLRSAKEENYASHWALPGGKADGDETPEQCADREVREEIGEVPEGKYKLLNRKGTPNGMVFSTFAKPTASKFAPVLNDEHSGYAWTSLDRLPQPLHPGVGEVLGKHIGVAEDMTPEDWNGLRSGFAKWTREEEAEPEHQAALDEALTDSVGRKHYDRVVISKANICGYKGSEIPKWQDLGLDPERIYQMLRDGVAMKKGASSFNGIQLLIKHTPVSAEDHKPYDVVGSLGTRAEFDDPFLYNDVTVWPQYAIDGIDDKSRHELSCSYQYTPDMTPGTYKGEAYDGVMRGVMNEVGEDVGFVGNHVAVIPKGRVGPEAALDQALPEHQPLKKEPPMSKKTALLSRTAIRLQAALSALAMDSKIDFAPSLKGVTAKNLKTRKPGLVKNILAMDGMEEAMAPATAGGATPDDVILRVLDMVESQVANDPPEADEAPTAAATDPNAGPPAAAGGPKMDKAKIMEWLKAKGMGEDDMSELDGMMGDPAEDEEETDEEKAARVAKAKDEAGKEPMVTKAAMDAALEQTRVSVLNTSREITNALSYVRPWVGELANDASIAAPADVYRKALASLNIHGAGTMHADALKSVLDAQPKPGERKRPVDGHLAMDAAAEKSLAERFPHAAKISNLG